MVALRTAKKYRILSEEGAIVGGVRALEEELKKGKEE
jgi:hypothetical protein